MKKIVLIALLLGLGVAFGAELDIPRLLKQCNANNGKACQNLSIAYYNGFGVAKDTTKAFDFAKKACDLNVARGCYNAGVILNEEKNDVFKAEKFFVKACNLNFGEGCYNAGVVLYEEKNDVFKAEKFFAKSCDMNFGDGCYNAGYMCYLIALQSEVSESELNEMMVKAYDFFIKGCDLGSGISCDSVASLLQNFTKEEEAKKYRLRACFLGYKKACQKGN